MEEIALYLNHHVDIKKVILFVGSDFNLQTLEDIFNQTRLSQMVVTGTASGLFAETILEKVSKLSKEDSYQVPEQFSYVSLSEISKIKDIDALVFDGIDNIKMLFDFLNTEIRMKYLIGNIDEKIENGFIIWECFRKHVEEMYIKTVRQYKEGQILRWKHNPENEIELSVVFPVYNVAKYLKQCLESITAWDADYVEYIFVNDGSPDNSADIIKEYAKKDSRIVLVNKENGGCASARQLGLETAKGNYIGFIDPDDYIDPSMYRKLMTGAMTGSYDVCYAGYNEYYESDGTVNKVLDDVFWPFTDGVTDPLIVHSLITFARVAIWRGIYKLSMIKNAGIHFYTDIRRFDDLPFKVEIFTAAKTVYAIPEPLYYYRLQRPGQDVSANDERLYVHFDIFDHLNKSIGGTKDPRLIDWLQMCKVQTHRYALLVIKDEFKKEYLDRASKDLKSTGTFWKTFFMVKKNLGKRAALCYVAMARKSLFLANTFIK